MKTMIAAVALALLAAPALAQDPNANPNYGTVRLSAGFTPDPYYQAVNAGGSINAGRAFNNCAGYISNAPDLRLYWNGGGSLPLVVSADSYSDTTLVINGPGGEWYCDDDSGEGVNPSIQLPARSGRYEIWVGTYNSGQMQGATVAISELSTY